MSDTEVETPRRPVQAPGMGAGAGEAVSHISVKPPPFYPDKPTMWFAQLDGQFNLTKITSDSTKFYHAISVLEYKYAVEVEDIITNPPASDKYGTLRRELIARLSSSKQERLKQLMSKEELGDRKPSQFLRHIRSLAGTDYPDDFIRHLWMSRLPTVLQSIVAYQDNLPLDTVAQMADKVHEVTPPGPGYQVAAASASSVPVSVIDQLHQKIDALTSRLDAMSTSRGRQGPPRSRSRGKPRNRSRSRSRAGKPSGDGQRLCWYHYKYADKADKCLSPCAYSKN
ncbi:uncharacterized protein LOC125238737 [Leguminivora glycinivorella]|uniref:uncharacterized protein LOC125238737 n=1 Tax=Leguminivora glycinivorella TaxID=1035111 RepID=UPI00200C919D|nr:uncharacterized protein LOC125238737 [Leguminivora glycinivorella]